MAKYVSKTAFTIGLLVLLMAVPAFGASINKSIDIAADEESGGYGGVAYLAEQGYEVVGVDQSQVGMDKAQALAQADPPGRALDHVSIAQPGGMAWAERAVREIRSRRSAMKLS